MNDSTPQRRATRCRERPTASSRSASSRNVGIVVQSAACAAPVGKPSGAKNASRRPAVSLLASHQGEPGPIPGRFTPGFSHVGIVPDDPAGQQGFLGHLPFPPVLSFRRCYVPASDLKTSLSDTLEFLHLTRAFAMAGNERGFCVRQPRRSRQLGRWDFRFGNNGELWRNSCKKGPGGCWEIREQLGHTLVSAESPRCVIEDKTARQFSALRVEAMRRVDARVSVAPSASTLLSLRRAKFLQSFDHLNIDVCVELARVNEVSIEQRRNEGTRKTGDPRKKKIGVWLCWGHGRVFTSKPTDQRHRAALFEHEKFRERPCRELNPVRPGGRRAVRPLNHRGSEVFENRVVVDRPVSYEPLEAGGTTSPAPSLIGRTARVGGGGGRVIQPPFPSPSGVNGAPLEVPVKWLARSSPTEAIRVQSPAGPLRIFANGNRCRGFSRDLPFSPPFHSGAVPCSPLSALKTSGVEAGKSGVVDSEIFIEMEQVAQTNRNGRPCSKQPSLH
ncbi:hypothetical protein PR048_030549 [Dryococelus australis]|uniref:Uncharacterized protein n=1 Tax=Dryococelus australis TaxID=614101 RepID=A0ABQ9G9A3_9NEOP|nr:hypothetical protein PR048_030549 [Dryococelus australis]